MCEELKPCPFCGQLEEIHISENTTSPVMNRPPNVISCDITHWCKPSGLPRCLIKITGRDKQEAIKAWNTRAALKNSAEQARVMQLMADALEHATHAIPPSVTLGIVEKALAEYAKIKGE